MDSAIGAFANCLCGARGRERGRGGTDTDSVAVAEPNAEVFFT